jgi:VanZ family protein
MISNPPAKGNSLRESASYWLPVLAWMGLIFFASSRSNLPGVPEPLLDLLLKKGSHFTAYGVLAFWWWRALSHAGLAGRWALLGGLLSAALYSATDELHQTFVPTRHGQAQDVLIDTAGAAVASGLIGWLQHAGRLPRT